jgi:hypothetical protein
LQAVGERFTRQALHRQEDHVTLLVDLVNRDNMLVINGGRGPRLAEEALTDARLLGQRRPDHLESHAALELLILAFENDSHAPRAKHSQHPVASKPADFSLPCRRSEEGEKTLSPRKNGRRCTHG